MSKRSKRDGLSRDLPWAALLQGVLVFARRWRRLSAKDRARLRRLLSESGGRIGSLTERDRRELRKLAGKLDLVGLGRELGSLAKGIGGRRRA